MGTYVEHYCGQVQSHKAHVWHAPAPYMSTAIAMPRQCAGYYGPDSAVADTGGYLGWNDQLLNRCEMASCLCGHAALDHAWHGCDDCGCTASAVHALLVSGEVIITPTVFVRPTGGALDE